MRELYIKPQIHSYETLSAFSSEFEINQDDLIFTEKIIMDRYISGLALSATVICRDEFGTGEPDDGMIDLILQATSKQSFKRVIAIGGGSVIDIAKLLALKDAYPIAGIFLKQRPAVKEKILVIVPTTCGTGSEVTNISIAHLHEKGTKLGLVDENLYADYAVLIAELVKKLPNGVFITSAVDALVHSAESYMSPKATVFTETFSLKAFSMLLEGFSAVLEMGLDYRSEIAGDMLKASCFAGIAFSNAGVGPVHALAYPLGGAYHVAHGEANYQFFAGVFNFYLEGKPGKKLTDLTELIRYHLKKAGLDKGPSEAFRGLEAMLGRLLPLKNLREYGMKESEIAVFSQNVLVNQQRLLVNSHIPFTYEIIEKIYRGRY